MIAPDANLLIYAHHPTSPFHAASRAWLEDLLSSSQPVGVPIFSISGFLRFMTNPRIHPSPATFRQATDMVDILLALPQVRILHPGDRHWELLKQLGGETRASGNFVVDVLIAAIAIEYGATIYTNDRDFARFRDLHWRNPLQP